MAALRRQSPRAVLGTVIFTSLLVLGFLIFFLDDLVHALRGRTQLVAVMTEARKLQRGAPVWIAGRTVGQVLSIEFTPRASDTTAMLALTLEIEERFLDQVRAGSEVRVTSDRLIGESVIDIVPGPASGPPIGAYDTIYSRRAPGAAAVMAKGRSLRAAIDSLSQTTAPLAGAAGQRQLDIARFQRGMEGVQRELGSLSAMLAESSGPGILSGPAFGASLDRFATTLREIGAALDSASARPGLAPRQMRETLAGLRRTTTSLSGDLDSLRSLLAQSGSIQRWQTDSAIVRAVHGVRIQIDSLIAEARRNPLRFVF
ncbi:MAG: MlaD family protein [Longimicrobiales bacterium]